MPHRPLDAQSVADRNTVAKLRQFRDSSVPSIVANMYYAASPLMMMAVRTSPLARLSVRAAARVVAWFLWAYILVLDKPTCPVIFANSLN